MSTSTTTGTQTATPLALPAPDTTGDTTRASITLDSLGPVVVNSSGTLSRISNWETMTPAERERTVRIIAARNQLRLANQENNLQTTPPGSTKRPRSTTPPE